MSGACFGGEHGGAVVAGLLSWHCRAAEPNDVASTVAGAGRSGAADLAAVARERPIVLTSSRANSHYGELFVTQPDGNGLMRIASERSALEPVWSLQNFPGVTPVQRTNAR